MDLHAIAFSLRVLVKHVPYSFELHRSQRRAVLAHQRHTMNFVHARRVLAHRTLEIKIAQGNMTKLASQSLSKMPGRAVATEPAVV